MKIRTMIGLGAIGSLLYLHRKRGGEWTVDSFADSAKQLWHGVQKAAEKAADEAKKQLDEARSQMQSAKAGMQSTGYGTDRFRG
jgi:hypothetical protein